MVCTLYCAHFLVSLFVSSLKLVRFLDCYHSSQKMPMCNKGRYGQLVTNIFRFPHHLISCNKVTNSQVIKLLLLFFFSFCKLQPRRAPLWDMKILMLVQNDIQSSGLSFNVACQLPDPASLKHCGKSKISLSDEACMKLISVLVPFLLLFLVHRQHWGQNSCPVLFNHSL